MYWCQKIAGLCVATLVAAEPGEAHGGAQFPELGPLLLGDAQGFAIQFLGGVECPCRSSSWPLCLFSSAAHQRSPVLSAICKASSNRVKASSICPAISHAPARRASSCGKNNCAPLARKAVEPLRRTDIPPATSPFLTLTQPR